MKWDFKIGIILLVLIAIVSISSSGIFFSLQNQEKNKRIAAERELRLTLNMKAVLEEQIAALEEEKTALELKFSHAKSQLEVMTSQVDKVTEENSELLVQLENKKSEVAELMVKLTHKEDIRIKLANELEQLKTNHQTLQDELASLKVDTETLKQEMPAPVSLDKIVVSKEESAPPISGQVLVVNKEFNFVVVDWGKRDGITQGAVLELCRNEGIVGEAQVEKVYEYMSAATILNENMGLEIKEGDKVQLKN